MIIEEIVSQHAEEAAFLWLLRDGAVRAPHYQLGDLAELEDRVEAHLDGLRVAGEAAWHFCEEGLQHEEVGEIFAAGFFALDSGRKDWLTAVLTVIKAVPETARGFISALGWVEREKLQGQVVEWLKSDDPQFRHLGLGACAVQRVDSGKYLVQAMEDPHPVVRARSLRAVGELRRRDLAQATLHHLGDEDEACRFWAAWSATLIGRANGLEALRQFVVPLGPYCDAALQLALRAMDRAAAVQWVRILAQDVRMSRLVVQATGIIGDPVSIPWLIEKMKTPEVARVAGEAFSMITGIDLAYDDLEGDWPEGFEAGPTENPEDEDVAMDADEDLPWPAPDLISKWWSTNQAQFTPGRKHACGQPLSKEVCLSVLRTGFQRQRRAAALELALLSPNEPLFNTSAPAKRQMRMLENA